MGIPADYRYRCYRRRRVPQRSDRSERPARRDRAYLDCARDQDHAAVPALILMLKNTPPLHGGGVRFREFERKLSNSQAKYINILSYFLVGYANFASSFGKRKNLANNIRGRNPL